jgi:hypothetical protein
LRSGTRAGAVRNDCSAFAAVCSFAAVWMPPENVVIRWMSAGRGPR